MKKILPVILLFVSLSLTAQNKQHWERIKALKVSFITEKLDLSTKEAQEFWPIYNEFDKQTSAIRYKDIKAIRKEIRENSDTMTNAQASVIISKLNDAENRMHKLRMGLSKKLLEIIPAKKIILLKIAEDDFKKKMLEEYKKRRKENH